MLTIINKFQVFIQILVFNIIFSNWANADLPNIKIAGSSTLYSFVTVAAERFGRISDFKTPIVENVGSGAGIKLLCTSESIDIAMTSRKILPTELKTCQNKNIKEYLIAYDGIVLAYHADYKINLSLAELKSIIGSKDYQYWPDINNPTLPKHKIEIYGPSSGSGARDTLEELVTKDVRSDNAYIEAGKNENLIIHKLLTNPKAFGLLSYIFAKNANVRLAEIDSISPNDYNIKTGKYKLSRKLYLYVNEDSNTPGVKSFIDEITSEQALGPTGYLTKRGLNSNW